MPHILIVCTANICRSPMAMAILDRKIREKDFPGDWKVTSAGTWARNGIPASEHGRNIMNDWGMDISGHRSRIVNHDMLHDADLVLTMEQGHKEALRAEFPDVAGKVFLLTEMIGISSDIRDPYGGPVADYLETAQELDSLIEDGLDRIIRLANHPGGQ